MSCIIEEPPVSEDIPAEVIVERFLAYDVYLGAEGILQVRIESSDLEEAVIVRRLDAEIIVAALGAVPTGPGTEELHADHPVTGRHSSDYLAELLERVLLRSDHVKAIALSL